MPIYEVKATRHYHTTIEVTTYIEALTPEQAKERIANEPHDWKENRASEDIAEMHNELTDIDERRPIIRIIQFCQRQHEAGRSLNDIIYWLQKEMPKGLDTAINDL